MPGRRRQGGGGLMDMIKMGMSATAPPINMSDDYSQYARIGEERKRRLAAQALKEQERTDAMAYESALSKAIGHQAGPYQLSPEEQFGDEQIPGLENDASGAMIGASPEQQRFLQILKTGMDAPGLGNIKAVEEALKSLQTSSMSAESAMAQRKAQDIAARERQEMGDTNARRVQGMRDRAAMAREELKLDANRTKDEVAARKAQQAANITNEDKLRGESQKVYDKYKFAKNAYDKISTALPTGPGDNALITAFIQLSDPGVSVKQGEMDALNASAGMYEKAWAEVKRVFGGKGELSESTRRAIREQAAVMLNQYSDEYNGDIDYITGIAKGRNLNPNRSVHPKAPRIAEPKRQQLDFVKKAYPDTTLTEWNSMDQGQRDEAQRRAAEVIRGAQEAERYRKENSPVDTRAGVANPQAQSVPLIGGAPVAPNTRAPFPVDVGIMSEVNRGR